MARIPYLPKSAPFTQEQRAWLNGYLAGLFADADADGASSDTSLSPQRATQSQPLLIMYGSQTGNAERIAKQLAAEANKREFEPRVVEMNGFASIDLGTVRRLIIVTSTWGDGDPPDNAVAFWNYLNSENAPELSHLTFSILALGDKNYADFCGAGKKFDARLEQLGAKRIHARTDCDTDYESAANAWMEGLWPAMQSAESSNASVEAQEEVVRPQNVRSNRELINATPVHSVIDFAPSPALDPQLSPFTRQNPFPAQLMVNRRLSAPGSAKDTRHLEISLQASGLKYEVGDALGVWPTNCPTLVNDLLNLLGCDGEEAVKDADTGETSLRNALLRIYQITRPPPQLLRALLERSGDPAWRRLLEPTAKSELATYLQGREIIDLLLEFPEVKFPPAEFIGFLPKLQPRCYSIASSLKAHPQEVHLTVAIVRYESRGRERKGVCSTFLADRVEAGTPVPLFVQASPKFRLPEDPDSPIIMIGPGTGIAPFRAFLEERRALGAKGRNWLFFGDQHRAYDFLYRQEIDAMITEGTLTRLETAFSRDQDQKIYVQNRMLEGAGEFWGWLEEGAHVYVCGDARRMAKDVDGALHEIVKGAGGRTAEEAIAYIEKLRQDKRYQRDVY